MVVTTGGANLDHTLADLEQRDVESATAEVEDQDGLFLLALVQAIGQRRRSRLVDDAQHVETGDLAGLLGRLTLGVVEVGGHGDDRLFDVLTEVGLGVFFSFCRMRALISCAVYFLPSTSMDQSVPIWRLTERTVRSTLVTAWFLAGWPTSTWPLRANATTDGVVVEPSEFATTTGSPPSRDRDDGVGGPEVDTDRMSHSDSS